MIFKESYGLCPYMAQMQKAARRNARIRRADETDEETDIFTAMTAHIRRRKERPARDRWISLANEAGRILHTDNPTEKEAVKAYLQMTREGIGGLGRREKEHGWTRIKNIPIDER